MRPHKVAEGIYNVGAVDWNIRDFHGYTTDNGTTYNAYLIIDDKVALVDTVKKEFSDQLLSNISELIDPRKIDYIISNHTEMDHSGGLPRIMHYIGEDKPLYVSKMGGKNLPLHFNRNWNYYAVENGETLSLGKRTLTFIETRMLHWPDSMFTYVNEDKILFSSDAFGQHYAGFEKFNDEMGDEIFRYAKAYFANILLLYTKKIEKLLEAVKELGLEFNIICPDHGIIWRKHPEKIINAYAKWSRHEAEQKAVVVYDTMWHSTQIMAEKIAEGISRKGIDVKPMHLRTFHRSDVMTEVMDARAVVVGSPTLNNNLFPTIADFFAYMKGLRPENKIGAAFGSYGWSGESVNIINKELEKMKFELIDSGIKVQYVPDDNGCKLCIEYGEKIGESIINNTAVL